MRRYGVEAADFDPKKSGLGGSDGLVWLQLRAFLQGNASFAKETTLAIRIRATQISQGSARKFSVISTRILKVWNGSALVELPTRNPVWAFYDAATNLDYGAKRSPGKIDFNAIVTLAAGADVRGEQFDFEFRSPDQVPNAFDTILKATRARHRWSGDLLSAVRDEQRTIPQLLLTDREIVRGSLTVNWALNSADQADAVLLEYLDQNIWGPAEVQYPPNSRQLYGYEPGAHSPRRRDQSHPGAEACGVLLPPGLLPKDHDYAGYGVGGQDAFLRLVRAGAVGAAAELGRIRSHAELFRRRAHARSRA